MVDVSEISKLSPEELGKVQSVISLFRLLGLTDEDISLLPQVLKNWPKVVEVINGHSEDLERIKGLVTANKGQDELEKIADDTPDNIRSAFGFGSRTENVRFDGGGSK